MTRLRRARLAGELVALGICHSRRCDTAGLFGQAVCCVSIRDLTRPGRPEYSGQILGSYVSGRLPEAERQVRLHAGHVGIIDDDLFAELALALGALGLEKVTPTGLRPNDLARGGKLETLGHGLLGFAAGDGFWHGGWKISECGLLGNYKKGKGKKGVRLKAEGFEPGLCDSVPATDLGASPGW